MDQGLENNIYTIEGITVLIVVTWSLDKIFHQLPANRSAEGTNNNDAIYETRLYAFLRAVNTYQININEAEEQLLDEYLPPWRANATHINGLYSKWFKANHIRAFGNQSPYYRFRKTVKRGMMPPPPPQQVLDDPNHLAIEAFMYQHKLLPKDYNIDTDYAIKLMLIGRDGGFGPYTRNARRARYSAHHQPQTITANANLAQGLGDSNHNLNNTSITYTDTDTGLTITQNHVTNINTRLDRLEAKGRGLFKIMTSALVLLSLLVMVACVVFPAYSRRQVWPTQLA